MNHGNSTMLYALWSTPAKAQVRPPFLFSSDPWKMEKFTFKTQSTMFFFYLHSILKKIMQLSNIGTI